MSAEGKSKIRVKKMKDRFWKAEPLFADQFIDEQLASNPTYYTVEGIRAAQLVRDAEVSNYMETRHQKWVDESVCADGYEMPAWAKSLWK